MSLRKNKPPVFVTNAGQRELADLVAKFARLPEHIAEAIPAMRKGQLICRKCGNHENLTAEKSAEYLRRGWPKCHDQTMELSL